MRFTLSFPIPAANFNITHEQELILVGSCFSNHIGNKLSGLGFKVLINPCGIVFNPVSILQTLQFVNKPELFTEEFVFEYNNLWHSWMHHGSFSNTNKQLLVQNIKNTLQQANSIFKKCDVIIITPGTAFIYVLKNNSQTVVANCHKVPQQTFKKLLLSPTQATEALLKTTEIIKQNNPNTRIIFTVSPVKHLKDGLHQNNISKGILHYAVQEVCQTFSDVYYFPAYEIVNDELRDYRFYDTDFAHPNDLAINYVWEKFTETYFNKKTVDLIEKIEQVKSMAQHKPINVNSPQHALFKENLKQKTEALLQEFPELKNLLT